MALKDASAREDARARRFPIPAGLVVAGGFVTELGALLLPAELAGRTTASGGVDLGAVTFAVFLLGWGLAVVGASVYVMRWTSIHRVAATAGGMVGVAAAVAVLVSAPVLSALAVLAGSGAALVGGVRWPAEAAGGGPRASGAR